MMKTTAHMIKYIAQFVLPESRIASTSLCSYHAYRVIVIFTTTAAAAAVVKCKRIYY